MHLALWDTPSADLFAAGFASSEAGWVVERHDPQTCTELLQRGLVDVALLPTLVLLSHPDLFDALPGAAFSSWKYPFVQLVLPQGMQQVDTVAFSTAHSQEALIARIILKEHYSMTPAFTSAEKSTPVDQLAAARDGVLLAGPNVPAFQTEHLALDLGQEWFELSNYPMVWGLFAARKDEATHEMVEALIEGVENAELQRSVFVRSREMTPTLHAFFADDLRVRFDDLAIASLTEFRQYLYYYHVTEEIPDLPLYLLPDDGLADDDDAPLI